MAYEPPQPPMSARPPLTGNIYTTYTASPSGNGTFVSVPTTPVVNPPPTPYNPQPPQGAQYFQPPQHPHHHQRQHSQTPHPHTQLPSRNYEDINLQPSSPYSIQKDNHIFLLQQTFRTRMGMRLVVLIASIGVLAGSTYVLNTYKSTKTGNGLWRDLSSQGGIDMSPVLALVATGAVALTSSAIAIILSLLPALRKAKGGKAQEWIALETTLLSFACAVAALAFTFSHKSMGVGLGDAEREMSFRRYTCDMKRQMYQGQGREAVNLAVQTVSSNLVSSGVGDPMKGVDARAIVLFASMCGQYNLSWILIIFILFFEIMIFISIALGRKWRKGLEKIEESEVRMMAAGKYQG
ncbi:hypothetical protein DFH27DRAFT_201049 [Peziza echinospora]|nr:hypothetical protein DFH27DRAFT_201049 [Peziza echinospora]